MSTPATTTSPSAQTVRGALGLNMIFGFLDPLSKVVGSLVALFGTYTALVGHGREPVFSFSLILVGLSFLIWRLWPEKLKTVPTPDTPAIRGLLGYNETDAERMFGRETDIGTLLGKVESDTGRICLVTGEPSSGKTSLLRAGLLPRLESRSWLPIFVTQSTANLLDEIRTSLAEAADVEKDNLSLAELIRRCVEQTHRAPVIVCDQFERLLISDATSDVLTHLFDAMRECLDDDDLRVRFVVCSRDRFEAARALEVGLKRAIPLLAQVPVARFAPERAEDVLSRMADHDKIPFTPPLRSAIVGDLTHDKTVCPAELQTVSQWMRDQGLTTRASYEGIGRAKGFLWEYLRTIVRSVDDVSPVGAARHVLRILAQRVDRTMPGSATRDEIVASYGSPDQATLALEQAAVDRALQHLVANGIVSQVMGGGYELIHPYFATDIQIALDGKASRGLKTYWRGRQVMTGYGLRSAAAVGAALVAAAVMAVLLGAPGAQPRWALTGQTTTLDAGALSAFDPENSRLAIDDGSKLVVWDLTPDRLMAWDVPRRQPYRTINHSSNAPGQRGVFVPVSAGFLSDVSEAWEVSLDIPDNAWRVDHVRLKDDQPTQPLEGALAPPQEATPCTPKAAAYSLVLDTVAIAYSCGQIVLLPAGNDAATEVRTISADEDKSCSPARIALSGGERHLAVVYSCSAETGDASPVDSGRTIQKSKLLTWDIHRNTPPAKLVLPLNLDFVENNAIASVAYRWDGHITLGVGSRSDFALYDVSTTPQRALVYTHPENKLEPNLVWLGNDGHVVVIQHDANPPELELQTVDLWIGPIRVPPFLPFRREVSGVSVLV